MTSRWDKLRKTTEQFVADAQERHGERYDYSLVDYFNSITPVTIICPAHGVFPQKPDGHLRGQGCARCAREQPRRPARKSTKAGFIERATAKHPTEGYDYSQVVYVDQNTPVTIICPTHGVFPQKPYLHLSRSPRWDGYCGCPRCGAERAGNRNRRSHAEFLRAALNRHGDRYGYSQATYRGMDHPVTIVCREHGPFEQTAGNHTKGQGCRQCQIDGYKLTATAYIERIADVYDQLYEYPDLSRFVLASDRVRVQCPDHGRFDVNSRTHLEGRSGCPGCKQFGSRFERGIQRVLEHAGIEFETQWTHPSLKHRRLLRFDFMLPKLHTLIEFDGAFHFKPIRMPGQTWEAAVRTFEETRRRDQIKSRWAQAHGWNLVRISTPNVEQALISAGILSGAA